MSSTKRQCPNWLETFDRWVTPRSEAPKSFILWTGLFALASALKRSVYIPESLLGGWTCYPNIFIFFVAPPGLRKTSTMDFLDRILPSVPQIVTIPQSATQEAIMALLTNQKDSAISIVSKEFGNLYKNSTVKLIEFLTAAFDGNKVFDNLTLMRGHELIYNPSVNLLAATTPKWIVENFTAAMLEGGFASRIIWVYEEELRNLQLFRGSLDHTEFKKLELNLVHDLNHITETLSGPVEISQDDQDYMDRWYVNFMRKEAPLMDSRVQGYVQRKIKHALTIAILIHIAKTDDLKITRQDFDQALKLLASTEVNMPTVFASVGKNPHQLDKKIIHDYVKKKGRVKALDLRRRFSHIATTEVLMSLLSAMCVVFNELIYDATTDTYTAKEMEP